MDSINQQGMTMSKSKSKSERLLLWVAAVMLTQPVWGTAGDIKPQLHCAVQDAQAASCSVYKVNADDLFADPEAYKAKPIRIIGWARLRVTPGGLYLERDAASLGDAVLIRLELDKDSPLRLTAEDSGLHDLYIEGTFNPSMVQSKTDKTATIGVISNIGRFHFWPSRS